MSVPLANALYDAAFWLTQASLTLGFSYRYAGRRHLPATGPVLLIANHQSFLDPLIVGLAARRRLSFLARKSLFKNRLFGGLIRALNAVPIDQQGIGKDGIQAILDKLQRGLPVLVFPEGERTHDGRLALLKPGVSLLFNRVQAPIVPVGIAGAFAAFPRTRLLPTPSPLWYTPTARTIAVAYGPPIAAEVLTGLDRRTTLDVLHAAIKKQIDVAESIRRGATRPAVRTRRESLAGSR